MIGELITGVPIESEFFSSVLGEEPLHKGGLGKILVSRGTDSFEDSLETICGPNPSGRNPLSCKDNWGEGVREGARKKGTAGEAEKKIFPENEGRGGGIFFISTYIPNM